ncbi:unnamed protein product [Amaranthus hypochondriacus]
MIDLLDGGFNIILLNVQLSNVHYKKKFYIIAYTNTRLKSQIDEELAKMRSVTPEEAAAAASRAKMRSR